MEKPVVDHQKRFKAAVDVIHNLPKKGSYQPSYDVMLRFYGLYKQAVCGPCTVPRPAFWDPVGRFKWEAWSRLGDMSSESAMAAYVDEMKKVAQEVIGSMPVDETTASLLHHFEPLYRVIDDMPQPPESLLGLGKGPKGGEEAHEPVDEARTEATEESHRRPLDPDPDRRLTWALDLSSGTLPNDSGVCEGSVLTSDSESETFCDSVDSVEQLGVVEVPTKSGGSRDGRVSSGSPPRLEGRQVGAGRGGEGAENERGRVPVGGSRDSGQDGPRRSWREGVAPRGSPRRGAPGGGGGRGGGDGPGGDAEGLGDAQLQRQIVLALQRLREDMRSVMERLEAVESLAAAHAQALELRPCAAPASQQEKWRPFDLSAQTVLLLLAWPFVAQALVQLWRRAQDRRRVSP